MAVVGLGVGGFWEEPDKSDPCFGCSGCSGFSELDPQVENWQRAKQPSFGVPFVGSDL